MNFKKTSFFTSPNLATFLILVFGGLFLLSGVIFAFVSYFSIEIQAENGAAKSLEQIGETIHSEVGRFVIDINNKVDTSDLLTPKTFHDLGIYNPMIHYWIELLQDKSHTDLNAKLFQEIAYIKDDGSWIRLIRGSAGGSGNLTITRLKNSPGIKNPEEWESEQIRLSKDLSKAESFSKSKGKKSGPLPPFLAKLKESKLDNNEKRWEGIWVYRAELNPEESPEQEKKPSGHLGVILAAKDSSPEGLSEGTVGITVSSNGLNTLLQTMAPRIGVSGTCMIFAKSNNRWILLSHSNPEKLPNAHNGDDNHFLNSLSAWEQMPDSKVTYLGKLLESQAGVANNFPQVLRFSAIDGQTGNPLDWRCNLRPMGGEGRPEWLVATLISENELFANPRKTFRGLLIFASVKMVLTLGICFLIAVFISRPIKMFSLEAKKMGALELEKRVPIQSSIREIQHLENSINDLHLGLKSFSKYVPADLVKQLLRSGIEAKPGGRKTEITILFADLEGFTKLSEKLPPEQLVPIICSYLDLGTQAVQSRSGTVDKYIGDAVMAFWNAPVPVENHQINACLAALKMKTTVFEFFKQQKELAGLTTRVRVGIHCGEAIVGNIGSNSRINYTALGDNVNLASRLEGLGKFYGTSILITRHVQVATNNLFLVRPVDLVAVKGKDKGVYIIELLDEKKNATREMQELSRLTYMAWILYRSRDFNAAISAYRDVSAAFPEDSLSVVMVERCLRLAANPPSDDWDGVYHAETK